MQNFVNKSLIKIKLYKKRANIQKISQLNKLKSQGMKLYHVKSNKLYDSILQLPLQNVQKVSINRVSGQMDLKYQFFYKGKQISVKQVKQLIDSNPKSESWIIVNQQPQRQDQKEKISYESHRQVIQKYIKETKTNQKQKIRQNAEFIFQNAIDGNFKYHTFEYFELEKQFTEQRKAQLLNEVFWKMCESQNDEINLADRKKKNEQRDVKKQKLQKEQVKNQKSNSISVNLNKIQSQKEQDSQQSQNEQLIKQTNKSQQVLQLHELEYINQNWKQLLCINKNLLKTNLDNLKYYAELAQLEKFQQKKEKMEIQGGNGKVNQKDLYNGEIQI